MNTAQHNVPPPEQKSRPFHRHAIAIAIKGLRTENKRLKDLVVRLSTIVARRAMRRK